MRRPTMQPVPPSVERDRDIDPLQQGIAVESGAPENHDVKDVVGNARPLQRGSDLQIVGITVHDDFGVLQILQPGDVLAERLLAVFDVFDKWFRRSDFEGCAFLKVLLEHDDRGHPVRKAAEAHIKTIRAFLRQLAEDAGVRDADAFARQLQLVMMGSIVAAYAGDRDAARRARELGSLLLARAGIGTGKGGQS